MPVSKKRQKKVKQKSSNKRSQLRNKLRITMGRLIKGRGLLADNVQFLEKLITVKPSANVKVALEEAKVHQHNCNVSIIEADKLATDFHLKSTEDITLSDWMDEHHAATVLAIMQIEEITNHVANSVEKTLIAIDQLVD